MRAGGSLTRHWARLGLIALMIVSKLVREGIIEHRKGIGALHGVGQISNNNTKDSISVRSKGTNVKMIGSARGWLGSI